MAENPRLSHLDESGRPRMVDVSDKPETAREATAAAAVLMSPETLRLAVSGTGKKGDVLTTARLAGIMAAKRTHELIPLCHPLPLTGIDVDLTPDESRSAIDISATVRTTAKTGVEMEALTAVSVAALTVYDMLKAAQKDIRITDIRLIHKTGGKSGDFQAGECGDRAAFSPDATDTLRLQTGDLITNCLDKVDRFCREDFSYKHYDGARVPEDDELTEEQVRLANKIIARMGAAGVNRFLNNADCIREALRRIPPGSSIVNLNPEMLGALQGLFTCVLGPGVGISRATKVLHKKRPKLIPILDDVVMKYAERVSRREGRVPRSEADRGVLAIEVLSRDVIENEQLLDHLAAKLNLSPLRVLDILLWAWSGEYSPVWNRGQT